MRPASGRWPQALGCVAAALLFRTAPSFQLEASLIHRDVSYYAGRSKTSRHPQTTSLSCSWSCRDMSPRGNFGPYPAVSSMRDRRRAYLSVAARAEKEGLEALSAMDTTAVEAKAGVLSKTETSGPGTQPPQLPSQQQYSADFLFRQRLESAKAALLCGGVGAASRLIAAGAGAVAPAFLRDFLALPESEASALLFGIASGFAQGALFGLTYRYVVRSDRQSASNKAGAAVTRPQMDGFTVGHLGDGCVAAFAFTSALGQSEATLTSAASEFVGVLGRGEGLVEAIATALLPAAPFLPRAVGDLLLYSAIRAAIDWALDNRGIESFP